MDKKFICEICNKNYKSYQSLWNHKHKFHEIDINQSKLDVSHLSTTPKPSVSQNKPDETTQYTCVM